MPQSSLNNNIFIARLSGRFTYNISKSKILVVEKHTELYLKQNKFLPKFVTR